MAEEDNKRKRSQPSGEGVEARSAQNSHVTEQKLETAGKLETVEIPYMTKNDQMSKMMRVSGPNSPSSEFELTPKNSINGLLSSSRDGISQPTEQSGAESEDSWTSLENLSFQKSLELFLIGTPDRLLQISKMVATRTVEECREKWIRAAIGHKPVISTDYSNEGQLNASDDDKSKNKNKGILWTQDEHLLFLLGLAEFGRGDWKRIAQYYVKSKKSTQVASHAQKFYLHQAKKSSENPVKTSASIHDLTPSNCESVLSMVSSPSAPHANAPFSFQKAFAGYNASIRSQYPFGMYSQPTGMNMMPQPQYAMRSYGSAGGSYTGSYYGSQGMMFRPDIGYISPSNSYMYPYGMQQSHSNSSSVTIQANPQYTDTLPPQAVVPMQDTVQTPGFYDLPPPPSSTGLEEMAKEDSGLTTVENSPRISVKDPNLLPPLTGDLPNID